MVVVWPFFIRPLLNFRVLCYFPAIQLGGGRTKVPTWGLVQFLGEEQYPYCLRVHYPDGSWCERTLRGVRPYLQGVHAQLPASVVIQIPPSASASASATVTNMAVVAGTLPPVWNLCLPKELLAAHQQLMPGSWCATHISHAAEVVQSWYRHPHLMQFSDITAAGCEVRPLVSVLNVGSWCTVLDPFCSNWGGVSAQLANRSSVRVVLNSHDHSTLADSHSDALQPLFWTSYLATSCCPDAVVCCVPPALLDVALPLMSRFVPCVCVLVPHDYVACSPEPRVQWLRGMQLAGRLQVIVGSVSQQDNHVHRCVTWLCVFQSPALRQRMLAANYRTSESLVFVSC